MVRRMQLYYSQDIADGSRLALFVEHLIFGSFHISIILITQKGYILKIFRWSLSNKVSQHNTKLLA